MSLKGYCSAKDKIPAIEQFPGMLSVDSPGEKQAAYMPDRKRFYPTDYQRNSTLFLRGCQDKEVVIQRQISLYCFILNNGPACLLIT